MTDVDYSALDRFSPDSALRQALIDAGTVLDIPAGDIFIRDGESADEVYMLLAGEARAFLVSIEGREMWISHLGPGDMVGEMAVLTRRKRSADVKAITDSRMLVIPGDMFLALMDRFGCLGRRVAEMVADRLQATTKELFSATTSSMEARVIALLRRRAARQSPNILTLSPLPVLSELALELGSTRETVSRSFNKLIRVGQIRRRDDHLQIFLQ